jgi:hypothetical protein
MNLWPIALIVASVTAGIVAVYKVERSSDIEMAKAGLQQCSEVSFGVRILWKKECK